MGEHSILVVDDDEDMARAVADILATARCSCEIATTGEAALTRCREREFDAVVSDVRMPDVDGADLVARVHAIQPDVPVILITARGTISDAVAAVKRGAFDYLTKPCEAQALRRVVEHAAASRRRMRLSRTWRAS